MRAALCTVGGDGRTLIGQHGLLVFPPVTRPAEIVEEVEILICSFSDPIQGYTSHIYTISINGRTVVKHLSLV